MSVRFLRVTQHRGLAGERPRARSCVRGLGLRRIGHSLRLPATLENLGMIGKARHLLTVKEDASEQN